MASKAFLQQAYLAYFGRPADPSGLAYYAEASEATVKAAFSASPESQAFFGSMQTAAQINAIYQNLFNRDAEPAGLSYWSQEIGSGRLSLADAAMGILAGAQNDDKTAVANKLAASEVFTAALDTTAEILGYAGAAAIAPARAYLKTVDATAASLTAATTGVTATVASVVAAGSVVAGQTFVLTAGADNIAGTAGNDTINALSVNADGQDATTLSGFDVVDGGTGTDTLNIYTTAADNELMPATASVKNVEIINIFNTGAAAAFGDASKFVGATQLWQHEAAVNVTKLAATTTAGFKGDVGGKSVQAAKAATSASIALSGYGDDTITVNAEADGVLNAVTVSGTAAAAGITLAATAGKDIQTLTVTTAVKTTLTAANEGGSTKALSTVDASSSSGAVTYSAAPTVANVKTGAGDDTVTNNFVFTATSKAATLVTGAGKDTVNVLVDNNINAINATVSVDAGDGDDTIVLNADRDGTATLGVTLAAGAGNDKVTLSDGIDSVATTDVIDGGEGADTVVIAGKTLDAEDYIILRDVVKNFESIEFTTTAASVDASRMAAYKSLSFAGAAGTVTKVAADQALTTTIGLTATASGYVLDSDTVTNGNQTTYAGTLNITAKAGVTVTGNAETVNLTVTPVTDKDGAPDNTSVTLEGDAKSATVTLNATTDNANTTASTTDDVLETSTLVFTNAASNAALTTLTISGNGSATVTNVDAKALVTVDASALSSVNIAGTAVVGLNYTTTNTKAETIKLGGGLDVVSLTKSSVSKTDTITGLSLVDNAAVAGTQVDTTKSDDIVVKSNDGTATLGVFTKTTTSAASLDLALVDLSASANDKLVFQFGGDTYIYADVAENGGAGNGIVNDADILVKLTGAVDLDLLISALNA